MVQMKNWEPLVSRPALAMASRQLRAMVQRRQLTKDTRASVPQLEVLVGELGVSLCR